MNTARSLLIFGCICLAPIPALAADTDLPAFSGGIYATMLDGGEKPINFSFSLHPAVQPPHLENLTGTPTSNVDHLADLGVALDGSVRTAEAEGGLSYFRGRASKKSRSDAFATCYFFNGWENDGLDTSESVSALPDDVFAGQTPPFASENADSLQVVFLYGGYELTPSLKIKGAFLVSKTKKDTDPADGQALTSESSYNWLLDVGGEYKLNESFSYRVNLGVADGAGSPAYSDSKKATDGSTYLFNNQLNMSF